MAASESLLQDNYDGDLRRAVQRGKAAIVKDRLARGASPNACSDLGISTLLCAVRAGRKDILELLLAAGADVHARAPDRSGWQHEVIDPECLALLLAADPCPEVDLCRDDGWTPLMCAARHGAWDVLEALLARGANVASCNGRGFTALDELAVVDVGSLREQHPTILHALLVANTPVAPSLRPAIAELGAIFFKPALVDALMRAGFSAELHAVSGTTGVDLSPPYRELRDYLRAHDARGAAERVLAAAVPARPVIAEKECRP